MFERGERDQYPPIGKGGHSPLQAFLGPGCRCANTRTHLTQFLLSLFGGGIDVLSDTFRSRFFWSHDFILSTLLLILQSLLRAASRQLPMRLPRQIRSWRVKLHRLPMSRNPTTRPSEVVSVNNVGLFRESSAKSIPHWQYNCPMFVLKALLATLLLAGLAVGQQHVSFPTQDGGVVYADIYGKGERGVVLAHGGRFNKESWEKQAQALVKAGFRALAIDFRGRGQSRGPGQSDPMNAPLHLDVLAAVRYLRKTGAKSVSVVGGSMGGGAAGDASIASQLGEIDRLVLLGASPNGPAEKLKSSTLFIVARDDANDDGPRLPRIREQYEKAPQPKALIILDGSAHAQFLFQTGQGERVMREFLHFFSAK